MKTTLEIEIEALSTDDIWIELACFVARADAKRLLEVAANYAGNSPDLALAEALLANTGASELRVFRGRKGDSPDYPTAGYEVVK